MNLNWMDILKAAVAESGQRKTAERLGYSTTTISLVLAGRYLGKTDKVAERVINILANVHCPYLDQQLDMKTCTETAQGQVPTHNPTKMQHWKACQTCIFNQKREEQPMKLPIVLTKFHLFKLQKINRIARELRKVGANVVKTDYTDDMRIFFTIKNPSALDDLGLCNSIIKQNVHHKTHHSEVEGVKLDWEVVA